MDNSQALATAVTIHRDEWGVAHILGPTDESVIFGMGFVQAEDNFWQLEDTTIRALDSQPFIHPGQRPIALPRKHCRSVSPEVSPSRRRVS